MSQVFYAVESQSTGVSATTRIAQYAYDGDGGRIKKTVYRRDKAVYNVNTGTTLFDTLGAPPKPATAANPTVEITKYVGQLYEIQGNRSTRFIYFGSTRVASVSGQDVMYYHTDHLGGTNALTDKAGLPRELTEYDPFGAIIKHEKYGDDLGTAWYYFTGKPLDDETGLMYYGARYYNPKLGRFITADTIVQAPDNPQTLNRYTYCNNNPINNIDDTGHDWWGRFIKQIQKIIGQANKVIDKVLDPIVRKLEQITHSKWSFNFNAKFSKEISWGKNTKENSSNSIRDRRVDENRNKSLNVEGSSYLLSTDEELSDLYNEVYSEEHPVTDSGLIHADGVFTFLVAVEVGVVRTALQVINMLKFLRNVREKVEKYWGEKNIEPKQSLEGTTYTQKVEGQRKLNDNHDFPDLVDNNASEGIKTLSIGKDGGIYTKIELYGNYRGRSGRFEWYIKHEDNTVNHRFFKADRVQKE